MSQVDHAEDWEHPLHVSIENELKAAIREAILEALVQRPHEAVPPEDREAPKPPGLEDVPAVMSPGQLAVVLDVSVRTLHRWREVGEGPAFQHPDGSRIYRYYRRDLFAWLENQAPATRS